MVVSHANDSYFWVVTQFSGMDVKTGYKLQTVGTLVQGVDCGARGLPGVDDGSVTRLAETELPSKFRLPRVT
jgi:hypothetical protein